MYICTEKQGHKSQTRADQKKKKVNKKQQIRAINLKVSTFNYQERTTYHE